MEHYESEDGTHDADTRVNDARTVFEAPKAGHSAKPAAAFDLIERASPGPYVELFARAPRLGWDHWGLGFQQEVANHG